MLRFFRQAILTLAVVGAVCSAAAFSLLGPFEAFQTPARGYNPPGGGADIGAPKNLLNNEEYRWNLPVLVYGFTESFRFYFGPTGMGAVSNAFSVLNAVPAATQMTSNLSEFATDTRRENFQASALQLLDLKSHTLSLMLNELGLTSPERYTWTIFDDRIINLGGGVTFTNYLIVPRNFDPVTYAPTPYVNDVLYTYRVLPQQFGGAARFFDAVEFPVDTSDVNPNAYSAVASGVDWFYSSGTLGFGVFFTGLTRDDAGGLRYLLRPDNIQNESLPGGSGISLAPYLTTNPVAVPILATNIIVTTNLIPPAPDDPVGTFILVTNRVTNVFAIYTNIVSTNFISTTGLRGGVDKITFIPAVYENGIGSMVPITNQFQAVIATNLNGTNILVTQLITRIITQPDILFNAGPTPFTGNGIPSPLTRSTPVFVNTNAAPRAGPGIIQPQVQITFNNTAPFLINYSPFSLDEDSSLQGYAWGSFDATTNQPVIYPDWTSFLLWQQWIIGN